MTPGVRVHNAKAIYSTPPPPHTHTHCQSQARCFWYVKWCSQAKAWQLLFWKGAVSKFSTQSNRSSKCRLLLDALSISVSFHSKLLITFETCKFCPCLIHSKPWNCSFNLCVIFRKVWCQGWFSTTNLQKKKKKKKKTKKKPTTYRLARCHVQFHDSDKHSSSNMPCLVSWQWQAFITVITTVPCTGQPQYTLFYITRLRGIRGMSPCRVQHENDQSYTVEPLFIMIYILTTLNIKVVWN